MANETTFAQIQAYTNIVWEGALEYLKTRFVAQNHVTIFGNLRGMETRTVTEYNEKPVSDNLGELDDLSTARQTLTRDILNSLSPKEIGKQLWLTDRRLLTDTEPVLADASMELGYTMGKKMEVDILSNMTNLSGGVVGANDEAMTLTNVWRARALLENRNVMAGGGYVCIMSPFQYLDIHEELTKLTSGAPLEVRDRAMNSYYVARVHDVAFVVSPNLPKTAPTNQQQTVTISGSPTGGSFTLSFYGRTTAPIAHNATEGACEDALEALATIGAGNVSVAKSGAVFTVTFTGALGGQTHPLLVANASALTGGTSPDVAVAQTVAGVSGAVGGLFTPDAIAFDVRRSLFLEPERDASARAWELNASAIYATGVWRSAHGVQILADNTAPNS